MRKKKSKSRLSLWVTDEAKGMIADLADRAGEDTLAGVVRRSLALYSQLLELEDSGGEIVVYQDGEDDGRLLEIPRGDEFGSDYRGFRHKNKARTGAE